MVNERAAATVGKAQVFADRGDGVRLVEPAGRVQRRGDRIVGRSGVVSAVPGATDTGLVGLDLVLIDSARHQAGGIDIGNGGVYGCGIGNRIIRSGRKGATAAGATEDLEAGLVGGLVGPGQGDLGLVVRHRIEGGGRDRGGHRNRQGGAVEAIVPPAAAEACRS